jgi:hypothetical protein
MDGEVAPRAIRAGRDGHAANDGGHVLEVIEREGGRGTGHVGPTGVGNLPRPKERGGCDCEVCARNREVLERRAGK